MFTRSVLTRSQVSVRQATEFSPALRPIERPGYIAHPVACRWNAWRWSGWNSWKPATLTWCWARIWSAPGIRATPDAIPGLAPPLAVCELPSRLKVAIVNVAPAPDDCDVVGAGVVAACAVVSASPVVDDSGAPAPGCAGTC